MSDEKEILKNYIVLDQSRVERSESHPGKFYLRLEGTQYLHGVEQPQPWGWDFLFDHSELVDFARKILVIVDPVSDEQVLERIRLLFAGLE